MLACVNPLRSQAFISCLITDEGGRGQMGSGVRNVVFLTDKKQANIAELAQFILTGITERWYLLLLHLFKKFVHLQRPAVYTIIIIIYIYFFFFCNWWLTCFLTMANLYIQIYAQLNNIFTAAFLVHNLTESQLESQPFDHTSHVSY